MHDACVMLLKSVVTMPEQIVSLVRVKMLFKCLFLSLIVLLRDLKMENIMLNEKQKSIKLIGKKAICLKLRSLK